MLSMMFSNYTISSPMAIRIFPLNHRIPSSTLADKAGELPSLGFVSLPSRGHASIFASGRFSVSCSSSLNSVAMMTASTACVIDGKLIAKQISGEISAEIFRMKDVIRIVPGLAVVLVGSRKDSQIYVRNKKKVYEAVGINSYEVNLPEDCTEEELLKNTESFNIDPSVHGILVQLPPSQADCSL